MAWTPAEPLIGIFVRIANDAFAIVSGVCTLGIGFPALALAYLVAGERQAG